VETALAFAAWLSGQTGFHYRLPSYQEWLQAAQGTSDPNRNCQVQLGSVHRGLAPVAVATGVANGYGLVNVLGNVQEWVLDGEEVKAAGGGYRDPIAECAVGTVRAQRGTADPATGFRLVREVS
jgi:formylglycine-generating enzyme required for sulfatase activity